MPKRETTVTNRWIILAVLFLARFAMAFQFESVAALAPVLSDTQGLSLGQIGLLIGLYLGPGVIVAIPGGAIAGVLGDRRVIGLSMLLMLAGGVIIALAPTFGLLSAGRALSGIGGVVINIVMTKMVVDWFTGREISTAIALFINSWPIGIAAALFTLPLIANLGGPWLAWIVVLAIITIALGVFLALYNPAENATSPVVAIRAARLPYLPLLLAASIWALFNMALATIYGFGPSFLTDRGFGLAEAGSMTGVFMIAIAISVPLGGVASDRSGRPGLVIAIGVLSFSVLVPIAMTLPVMAAPYILTLGLFIFGLSAGPVVALPSRFLAAQSRAFGMGVYYSYYYGLMMIAPPVAGGLADLAGDPAAALLFGVACCVAGLGCLAFFFRIEPSLSRA